MRPFFLFPKQLLLLRLFMNFDGQNNNIHNFITLEAVVLYRQKVKNFFVKNVYAYVQKAVLHFHSLYWHTTTRGILAHDIWTSGEHCPLRNWLLIFRPETH